MVSREVRCLMLLMAPSPSTISMLRRAASGTWARGTGVLTGLALAQQALAAGVQSDSKDFPNLVHVTLSKMDNVERIQGQGVNAVA